jgi:hypothetical protein
MLLCTISCKLLKELFSVVVEYATDIARCCSTIWKDQEISMLQLFQVRSLFVKRRIDISSGAQAQFIYISPVGLFAPTSRRVSVLFHVQLKAENNLQDVMELLEIFP